MPRPDLAHGNGGTHGRGSADRRRELAAKIRNPLGVIGLSLITLGIYFFFWWYYVNREMRELGKTRGVDLGQKPSNSVWAVRSAGSSSCLGS